MNPMLIKTLGGMSARKGITGVSGVLLGIWLMVNFPDLIPTELRDEFKIGAPIGTGILLMLSTFWSMSREEHTKRLRWQSFLSEIKEFAKHNGRRLYK